MTFPTINPRQALFTIGFILLLAYAFYQGRFLILGPSISITSHQNGAVVEESVVNIGGKAQNVAWISLNDRQIFTNEEGLWSEKLILSPGTSIMTVKARDRFGREKTKSLILYLK